VKLDRRLLMAMLLPGLALGLWLLLGGVLFRLTLNPGQRAALAGALDPLVATHGMLPVLWWLVAAVLAAWAAYRLNQAYVATPARLADATRVLVGDATAPELPASGNASARALSAAINGLAQQRRALQQDMARLVAEASRDVAEQRDQLGALMAELDQSVVVCNLEGRILLYNERARQLFRRLSRAPAGGAELIGLGRSIHGVIDPALIAHALETVEQRIASGAASASGRFVTGTPAGHLLGVNLAPVRPAAADTAAPTGYVLLLDDITDDYEMHTRRDRQLLEHIEAGRASLATMQVALDVLDDPDLDAPGRDQFGKVVRDEVTALGTRLATYATTTSQDLMTRWPLQDMLGADLLDAARRRIEADHGQPVTIEPTDRSLWLSIDSFALIQALSFLAGRLIALSGRPELRLRLAVSGGRACLDLAWSAQDASPDALRSLQSEPMQTGAGLPLTVRDIAERHGGEFWVEHDRASGVSFFRFLLPLATSERAPPAASVGSRPEYYDFDLFAGGKHLGELDDRLLSEIAYTVFDTETTGLDPTRGDEIIQIGATRIVNGKILRGECFDQLVDPGRSIPEASFRIHGIGPEHVRGKPSMAEILPAFHAFVGDAVLVGHNVAFDMRFLKLKEESSGVVFNQPILDTLLLSSVVHPNEALHSLEAIAARLGVTASSRHNALGDALSTAEVFLKLLPLLRQRGILTLTQARGAAEASYYARLRY
jgi:DNA polymerase-3 subunit epsilon